MTERVETDRGYFEYVIVEDSQAKNPGAPEPANMYTPPPLREADSESPAIPGNEASLSQGPAADEAVTDEEVVAETRDEASDREDTARQSLGVAEGREVNSLNGGSDGEVREPGEAEAQGDVGGDGSEDEADASPAARELAEAEGVDLSEVEGSGEDGRILKSDVEAHLED